MVEFELFRDEYKIYFDEYDTFNVYKRLNNSNEAKYAFVKFLFALNQAELLMSDRDLMIIRLMPISDIEKLTHQFLPKYGELFNIDFLKESSSDDLDQIMHYFLRYGLGLDDHNYDLKIKFKLKDTKDAKQITFMGKSDLAKKINSIYLNISNPTNKDIEIVRLFSDEFQPKFINSKMLLNEMIKSYKESSDKLKKFLEKYECRTPNDILQIIDAVEQNNLKHTKVSRYPQFLKTFIVRSIDKLAKENYQNTIDFVARYRIEWQKIQFNIITTSERYKNYKNAQKIFNLILKRDYSDNSLTKLNKMKFKNFEEAFKAYYEYNATFAYKNIVNLLRKFNFCEIPNDLFAKYPPTSSRSLIQAVLGVLRINHNKRYFYNGISHINSNYKRINLESQFMNIVDLTASLDDTLNSQITKNKDIFDL